MQRRSSVVNALELVVASITERAIVGLVERIGTSERFPAKIDPR